MAGFVTGFTFFIVPTFATDHFVLRSSVSDIGGKSLRTVENNDSMKTWLGIWLIPAMGKTPAKALTNTVENQIKDALKTHVERGNLKYSETSQYYLMRGKG